MPPPGGTPGAGAQAGAEAAARAGWVGGGDDAGGDAAAFPAVPTASSPPPVPYARVVRPATLAVGHFHAVLARGAVWWRGGGGGGAGGDKRPTSLRSSWGSYRPSSSGSTGPIHVAAGAAGAAAAAATNVPAEGDALGGSSTGVMGLSERGGRGSSVWTLARRSGGGRGLEGVGRGASARKRGRWRSNIGGGSVGGESGSFWAARGEGGAGAATSIMNSLDEFHANPRLRFQLLLREQGVVVTLFDAMKRVRFLICCCDRPIHAAFRQHNGFHIHVLFGCNR